MNIVLTERGEAMGEQAKIIEAMDAAGYYFDKMESTDDQLRFLGDYGTVMYMDSWKDAKEWLDGVVFDDPDISDRVEKILHPERFSEKKPSVLKRLEEKKSEVHKRNDKKELLKKKAKDVRNL